MCRFGFISWRAQLSLTPLTLIIVFSIILVMEVNCKSKYRFNVKKYNTSLIISPALLVRPQQPPPLRG